MKVLVRKEESKTQLKVLHLECEKIRRLKMHAVQKVQIAPGASLFVIFIQIKNIIELKKSYIYK